MILKIYVKEEFNLTLKEIKLLQSIGKGIKVGDINAKSLRILFDYNLIRRDFQMDLCVTGKGCSVINAYLNGDYKKE